MHKKESESNKLIPKTMLIVNPVSGKGRVKGFLLDILEVLCAGGTGVGVFLTEKPRDASLFVEQYGGDFERVACTGGDGTLSEVIGGLMRIPREKRPAIGYIPLGTTNDMASSLNIPKDPKNAIALLAAEPELTEPRTVDVGSLGDDYFGYVAAFGTFTDIPFTTPQVAKNTWGYLAYVTEALGRISQISPIHAKITHDNGIINDEFLLGFVLNSTTVAGFVKLTEHNVALDDGIFEILLVRAPKAPGDLGTIVSSILLQDFNNEFITLLHTRDAKFEFDVPVQWTRDGENGGVHTSVEVKNHNKAVRIFV